MIVMYREDDKLKFFSMLGRMKKMDILNLMMVAYENDEKMDKFIVWCRNMLRKPNPLLKKLK